MMIERVHEMRCAEVFGGNGAVDEGVVIPDLDIWVFSRPCCDDPEGGDIVLLSRCEQGKVAKAYLADVAGHGERVAPIARGLQDLVRRYLGRHDHECFFRGLNEDTEPGILSEGFATMVAALHDRERSLLVYSYAGHPRILFRRGETGELGPLEPGFCPVPGGLAGLAIGMIPGTSYFQSAVPFRPGDMAVLYSDGWTETRRPGGGRVTEEDFLEVANRCSRKSARAFRDDLLSRYRDDLGVTVFSDDISLIVILRL